MLVLNHLFLCSLRTWPLENPAEAGWVPELAPARRDRWEQPGGCHRVHAQIPGWQRDDLGRLQPAAQTAHCQGQSRGAARGNAAENISGLWNSCAQLVAAVCKLSCTDSTWVCARFGSPRGLWAVEFRAAESQTPFPALPSCSQGAAGLTRRRRRRVKIRWAGNGWRGRLLTFVEETAPEQRKWHK